MRTKIGFCAEVHLEIASVADDGGEYTNHAIIIRGWGEEQVHDHSSCRLPQSHRWTIILDSQIRSLLAYQGCSATSGKLNVAFGDPDGVYVHQFAANLCK